MRATILKKGHLLKRPFGVVREGPKHLLKRPFRIVREGQKGQKNDIFGVVVKTKSSKRTLVEASF